MPNITKRGHVAVSVLAACALLFGCSGGGEDGSAETTSTVPTTAENTTTTAPTTTTTVQGQALVDLFADRVEALGATRANADAEALETFAVMNCGNYFSDLMKLASSFREQIAAAEIVCPATADRIRSLVTDGAEPQYPTAEGEKMYEFLRAGYSASATVPAELESDRAAMFLRIRGIQANISGECSVRVSAPRAIRQAARGGWIVADDDKTELLVVVGEELITTPDGAALPPPYASCDPQFIPGVAAFGD